jgi:outer membrane protein
VNIWKQLIMTVAGLTLVAGVAQAQGRVAVLDLQAAIINTEQAQSQFEQMRNTAEYKENKEELDDLVKNYEKVLEDFRKNREVMSAEQQQEQASRAQSMQADIEHVRKKLQNMEVQLAQRILQEMAPRAQKVVNELIQVEGIGLLLRAEAALHADVGYSLNAKVTDKLNQGG